MPRSWLAGIRPVDQGLPAHSTASRSAHLTSRVSDQPNKDSGISTQDASATGIVSDSDRTAVDLSSRFRERLRFFAARQLGDVAPAEDVAQETLHQALAALRAGRVRSIEALPAFLFETARHICLQRIRSRIRERKALHRLASSGASNPAADPLADLISRQRLETVRDALRELGEEDRELLALSYAENVSTDEIARRLGVSAGAVRVRRHRAIGRLAELLGVTKQSDREP